MLYLAESHFPSTRTENLWIQNKVKIMLFSVPNPNTVPKPNPNRPMDGK